MISSIVFLQLLLSLPPFLYYYFHICKCYSFYYILLSKTSAFMINFNLFILLLTSTNIHKKIFHIPNINPIHKILSYSLIFWTTLHTITHHLTLQRIFFLQLYNSPYSHPTISSGYTLLTLVVLIPLFIPLKYKFYNTFLTIHFLLNTTILFLTIYHGSLCFLKLNHICPTHTSWIWLLPPLILYTITIILKYTSLTPISSIHTQHNFTHVQLPLPHNFLGKYIFISNPQYNPLEWHPFSISHYNTHNNTCSIIIKHSGDWTTHISHAHPAKILYHGPFISLPTINPSHTNIFISTGIAITSFSHLLIHHTHTHTNKFIIITQTPQDILWLLPLIHPHNYKLISIFFTQKYTPIIPLDHIQHFNHKPNLYITLHTLYIKSLSHHNNIFFSGNPNTLQIIKKITFKKKYYKVFNI